MPDGKAKSQEKDGEKSELPGLLRTAGEKLLPLVASGAGLVGFVAFAGAVIVWTRLSAVRVPPEQVISAFPRGQLVAIGATLLLVFGFFGALATIAAYLVDRGGRATPGMARGLLLLLVFEGIAAAMLVPEASWQDTAIAATVFALAVGVALWATFVDAFVGIEDQLHSRTSETAGPLRRTSVLLELRGGESGWWVWAVLKQPLVLSAIGLIAATALLAVDRPRWPSWLPLAPIGLLALLLVWAVWIEGRTYYERRKRVELEEEAEAAERRNAESALRSSEAEREKRLTGKLALLMPGAKAKREAHRMRLEEAKKAERLANTRPYRLLGERRGVVVMSIALAVAVAVPAAVLGERWLAGSLASAVILCGGLWRVAILSRTKFGWFGLAVFISIPLFGTLSLMGRNLDNPQVQPIALIRSTDGPDEAIQGLYVTETKDRVYFANVGTEGCGSDVMPGSGRLMWVPADEVVAMAVGPHQSVEDAGRSALEMSYALTSSVETPTGERVDLAQGRDTDGEKSETKGEEETAAPTRLENAGPAIRPNFGRGLRLVPPDASPAETVTLKLRHPAEVGDEEGFGSSRKGRTLRLDGVEVDIAKEPAKTPEEAEFVAIKGGGKLRLDKQGVYTWFETAAGEGEYRLVGESQDVVTGRFVKLEDSSVVAGSGKRSNGAQYLELEGRELKGSPPRVKLRGVGKPVELKPELVRQAWRPDRIRFIVPEEGTGGVITVECEQLAGQPLLDVVRPSTARITVRMQTGSQRVVFDSRHSGEEGGAVESRQWTVAGRPMGGREKIAADLPPRRRPYSVQLTVTNRDGQSDSIQLKLLRLPASLFEFGEDVPVRPHALDLARKEVRKTVEEARPAAIEVHGHSDDVGTDAYNLRLSLRRAVEVRKALFRGQPPGGERVPVTTRAFGESCPIDLRGGRRQANRRVEVFILGRGAIVSTSDRCRAAKVKQTNWTAPSDGADRRAEAGGEQSPRRPAGGG